MKNMRAFFILMLLVQLGVTSYAKNIVTSYAKNISKFSVVEDLEMKPRRMYKSMQSIKALDYWNKTLGAVVMPSLLRDMISPLSTVAVNEYKEMIEKHLFFSNDKLTSTFCISANLLCRSLDDQNLEIIASNLFRIFYYKAYVGVASTPAIKSHSNELENFSWFYEKDMFLNITKVYPKNLFNIESKAIQRSFLPRTLAAAFGNLSSNSAKFLVEAFNISNTSILAKLIYETAALCEEEATIGEIKLCIQSVEDLVGLTKQMLDPSSEFDLVEVLSGISRLPAPKNVDNKEWKIVKVEPKGDTKSKYISCHSAIFLYQVYVCHYIPKTKIFSVSIESIPIGHTKLEVIVLCHTDTSMWDPNHIAFRVLGGKPGTTSICHWSSYDALVFVKHNNAANI